MKSTIPVATETRTIPATKEQIAQLKALFPQAISDGQVDFDALRRLLGGDVVSGDEQYSLQWHGKRRAEQLAFAPPVGTLRPRPDDSVDWDATRNMLIEGDNLEVLKLLQRSHAGQVKVIYIDPPYNTGNDFVYPDDYRDSIRNYLQMTGQRDDRTRAAGSAETDGRFHTAWLSMMYPRLLLARELLRTDGLIVVSIDDTELPNLRRLLDEIFGEENFLAVLVWDRNRKNDARYFSVGHEYMVVYARDEPALAAGNIIFRAEKEGIDEVRAELDRIRRDVGADWKAAREKLLKFYRSIPDDDPRAPLKRFTKVDERGPYRDDGNITWPGGGGPRYEVLHPVTGRLCKMPPSGWRYPTPERFWEEVARGRIVFGPDESTVPRVRTNLFDNAEQVMSSVHYSYAQTAAYEFSALFDGARVFDNPKPVSDLRRLVAYLTRDADIVCDFFAGSGTTGHAIMAQNAADGGSRQFILVQLPEPLDSGRKEQQIAAQFCDRLGKPRVMTELTKERLRRAAARIREERPAFHGDLGFRVFNVEI